MVDSQNRIGANESQAAGESPERPVGLPARLIAYGYLVSVPFEIDFVIAGRSVPFWLAMALIAVVTLEVGAGSLKRAHYKLDGPLLLAALSLLFYVFSSYLWSVDQTTTFSSALVLCLTLATWAAVAIAVSGSVAEAFRALLLGTSVLSIVVLNAELNIDGRAVVAANSNDVAALITVACAYLVTEATARNRRFAWRIAALLLLLLHLAALLATGSRTGVLAVVASAAFLLSLNMAQARLGAFSVVLVCGFILANIAPIIGIGMPDRISQIPDALAAGDLSAREDYWRAALEEIPNLAGIGFGATPAWMVEQTGVHAVAHSSYLGVALELGVIGIALWGCFIWLAYRSARLDNQSVHLLVAAVAMAVMASTLSLEVRRPLWVLLALMASHAILVKKGRENK